MKIFLSTSAFYEAGLCSLLIERFSFANVTVDLSKSLPGWWWGGAIVKLLKLFMFVKAEQFEDTVQPSQQFFD